MKAQATKASAAQVRLHIRRQRKLNQRMIGDNDEPTRSELLFTAVALIVMAIHFLGGGSL